ncbi:Plasmid stabilization system protein ParE [Duganella sp. CF402]|nr:plasmid stabilization system protein ParE [Duganella sp. BK701]SEM54034.1 Plasmid stabilization system protein ParE [Duganella sp. CF402]
MVPSGNGAPAKLVIHWSPQAKQALSDTLLRIDQQDPRTSRLVLQRLERVLAVLAVRPELGTQVSRTGFRRFFIPKTGHYIDYRILGDEILISKWRRLTRRRKN